MKQFLIGLAVLPFVAGVALAGAPLTNQQMDQVTAGAGPSSAFGFGGGGTNSGGPSSAFGFAGSGGTSGSSGGGGLSSAFGFASSGGTSGGLSSAFGFGGK